MNYKIVSGRYETGTEEQKSGYKFLFGEDNIQYKFDLYFHWYNLVHEVGHCIVEKYGKHMSKVEEEMYVNEFAVAYYRHVGETNRLSELEGMLKEIIDKVPSPVPQGQTFTSYFESIWGTEALNNVMTYGFFQLNSVLEAMKNDKNLNDVTRELGVALSESETVGCSEEISSANAETFLKTAIENLKLLGLDVPGISLELVDNPMIQCAQNAE